MAGQCETQREEHPSRSVLKQNFSAAVFFAIILENAGESLQRVESCKRKGADRERKIGQGRGHLTVVGATARSGEYLH